MLVSFKKIYGTLLQYKNIICLEVNLKRLRIFLRIGEFKLLPNLKTGQKNEKNIKMMFGKIINT